MGRVPGISLALAYTPAQALDFFQRLAPAGVQLVAQAGADLGERLTRAFAWGFSAGFDAVLVRNSDSPDLPGRLVTEAQGALARGEAHVVLVPAPDGGYNLVGLRSPKPELFQGVAWSTPRVLADTLSRARALSLAVHLLPPWPDIDTPADLVKFLEQDRTPATPGWRSYHWLRTHLPSILSK